VPDSSSAPGAPLSAAAYRHARPPAGGTGSAGQATVWRRRSRGGGGGGGGGRGAAPPGTFSPGRAARVLFRLGRRGAENPQRVFNRAELEESLYGWGEGAESNTIDVHVHHLRKKLGPGVIKTIRGVGYRLGDVGA